MQVDYWRLEAHPTDALPPLFWVARISPPLIEVRCGMSVRHASDALVEGTWAGGPELRDVARAATVYATGIVLTHDGPLVVTRHHPQDALFATRRADATYVSNSFAGLLSATGLQLDPDYPYPDRFGVMAQRKHLLLEGDPPLVAGRRIAISTLDGEIEVLQCENFRVAPDGRLVDARKPREATFTDYDDYSRRIHAALASMLANAPGYTPLATLSRGYDSTAVAAVGAAVGCRQAIGLRSARRMGDQAIVDDSGAEAARRLGLDYELFDRLAYRTRTDLPEAEFLATGLSGEDVPAVAFEARLGRTVLLTGHWGGPLWAHSWRPSATHRPVAELSGGSLTDFRLRLDVIDIALPYFGALQDPVATGLEHDPTMAPYRVGGYYDRPVARRLAEEAGLPRGSFAAVKIAGSALLHRDPGAFSPATLADIERFAAAEGRRFKFRSAPRPARGQRLAARRTHAAGVHRLGRRLERRAARAVHFENRTGNLVLRWAVSVVAPRYAAARPSNPRPKGEVRAEH